MPDADKPEDSKPIRVVFPRGATAEEIAKALQEMIQKHVQKPNRGRGRRERGRAMSKPKWTPEEQEIIDVVARSHGREFAEKYAELALEQARMVGDLERDPKPDVVAFGDH